MHMEEETDDGRWLVPRDAELDRAKKRTILTPTQMKIDRELETIAVKSVTPAPVASVAPPVMIPTGYKSASIGVIKDAEGIKLICNNTEVLITNEKLVSVLEQHLEWSERKANRIVI